MTNTTITERQRYWRDQVLAATAYSGTIAEYAETNKLKTKDIERLLPFNLKPASINAA